MNDLKSQLPNLLVIGAMKAGTTSFHEILNQHPEVFMSEVKEINFFSLMANYNKGITWYRNHFIGGENCKYRGESSVSYSKIHMHPGTIDRIVDVLDDEIKIIYILRDPIKRFESNFTDSKTYGDIPPETDINKYLKQNSLDNIPYLHTGRYFFQIKPFLNRISFKNILLLEFEQLIFMSKEIMEKVFKFLELEAVDIEMPRLNNSAEKRYLNKFTLAYQKSNVLRNAVPPYIKKNFVNSYLFEKIFKSSANSKINKLNQESTNLLTSYYKEDINQLSSVLNFKPQNWTYFNLKK